MSRAGSSFLFRPQQWLLAVALVVVVFLAYQPAWHGGFLLDDDVHVPRPDLSSWHGLYRIWCDVSATQQYYPVLESTFWLESKLWGNSTLGYHCVNILLHAVAALMVAWILRRLAIPGAYLAAAIFALHPVCVESAAWISEQKNTQSAVFYFGAMIAYLGFDQTRKKSLYAAAFGLLAMAVWSKTVAVTLPAALLVIFWWQRGKLSWRRDALPLVPFFAFSVASALLTLWVERTHIGAQGGEFELTGIQRCLIAGRAFWFYLGKIVWPTNLMLVYPHWQIDPAVWWQYLFPAAALLLVAALWMLRRWSRGLLAGVLFFSVSLFPVLGVCSLYWFSLSYVADHLQYLAIPGIVALVSAGIVTLLSRWGLWNRPVGHVFCLGLLATLATLTWRQSRTYVDNETLCRTTIAANPDAWMAYNNLGKVLVESGQSDKAVACFLKSRELHPALNLAPYNLGTIFAERGQLDEAIAYFREALTIAPDYADAHYCLGNALAKQGRFDEAISCYRTAVERNPEFADAHYNLGITLASCGRIDEALSSFRETLRIQPARAEAWNNLGGALMIAGRIDEAIECFQKALAINPQYTKARENVHRAKARQTERQTGPQPPTHSPQP